MTREQLFAEAMSLAPADREALADELLLSLRGSAREEVDAAWVEEVKRRDAAFQRGETTASPVEDVIARVLSRKRS